MPPRIRRDQRVSPLYASLGPKPSAVQAYVSGELGLSGEPARARAEAIVAEFRAWREQHLEGWERGERVPDPPYADRFDTFARPAA